MERLISRRRSQGWSVIVQPTAGERVQLADVSADVPSTVSISAQPGHGKSPHLCDGAFVVRVETRIDEAVRVRTFESRAAGISTSIPAGRTYVYAEAITGADVRVYVLVSPGIALVEHVAQWVTLNQLEAVALPVVPFARTVTIQATTEKLFVNLPTGQCGIENTSSAVGFNSMTLPAYAFTSIQNGSSLNATTALITWEIES